MLKLFKSFKILFLFAFILIFFYALGSNVYLGKEDEAKKEKAEYQELFAEALKAYYIGEGDLETALNLHSKLQGIWKK